MGNIVSISEALSAKKSGPKGDEQNDNIKQQQTQTPTRCTTQPSSEQYDESDPKCCSFKYERGVCALSWWEPIRLLEEGSISDIHLVRRMDKFVKVRYKDKRNIMDLAKKRERGRANTGEAADLCVLKSIMKDHIFDEAVLDEMRSEIEVMSKLCHPNIVRLIEAYERRRHIYLVMEFCSGGNLASRIPMKPEKDASVVVGKVLSAVAHMHSRGLAHRDIKLENIMIDARGDAKLIDFGLATAFLSDKYKNMTDKVGTLYSMAPQVLQGVYDFKCDLWSIGVVAYMLLSGKQPFWGPNKNMPWSKRRKVMIDQIMRCKYAPMVGTSWEGVSKAAKSFVRSLLVMDPKARPNAEEALQSEWIRSRRCDTDNEPTKLKLDFDEKRIARRDALRRNIWSLLASKLSENEIEDMQAYLEVHDDEGCGFVRLDEFRDFLEEAAESSENVTKADVNGLFADEALDDMDMASTINYVDFMVEVLVGRGRNDVEQLARELDGLDKEGTRRVHIDDLRSVIDSIFLSSPYMQDEWWEKLDVTEDGFVNTVQVLELVDAKVVKHYRESVRSGRTHA